jgi:hypothetical protein
MDKENTPPGNPEAAAALRKVITDFLSQGTPAADLVFNLTYMGAALALQTAPSPVHAMMLLTAALSLASRVHCADVGEETGGTGKDSEAVTEEGNPRDCSTAGATVH